MIETNIPADRLVEVFGAALVGAAGVLAVSGDGTSGAMGTTLSATGVLTDSAGVAAAFRCCADGCAR